MPDVIADSNGDELEHGKPDFPGQFPGDFAEFTSTAGNWEDGEIVTVREYLDAGGVLPIGIELDDDVEMQYVLGSTGTARFTGEVFDGLPI